jgi:Sec-independent protein translocase protein TatA
LASANCPKSLASVGKGIKEFRKESGIETQKKAQVDNAVEKAAVNGDTSAPQA